MIQILESYSPEDDEVRTLLQTLLYRLANSESIEVLRCSLNVFRSIIENIPDILNCEDEDIVDLAEGISYCLLRLIDDPRTQELSFKCWNEIGKYCPNVLIPFETDLIEISNQVLGNSDDKDCLIQACLLIKRISKLEILDETETLNSIEDNIQNVVLMLVDVCCSITDEQCSTNDTWEPYIAAYEALKLVAELTGDTLKNEMSAPIFEMFQSSNFQERDSSLRLLECIIRACTDDMYVKPFLPSLKILVTDQCPCIRFRALRCIRRGLRRIVKLSPLDSDLNDFSSYAISLLEMLDDDPQIASEITNLVSIFVKIPNFPETSQILTTLLNKATSMRQNFAKDPFKSVESIIEEGDHETVIKFFPIFIDLYSESLSNSDLGWLIHDLGDVIQTYAFRFKTGLISYTESITNLLIHAINDCGLYSSDALLPLASMGTIGRDVFLPYLPSVFQIYEQAILQTHENDAVYAASLGLSLLAGEGFIIDNVEHWFEILTHTLTNNELSLDARSAIVQLLGSLASAYPLPFMAFSTVILGHVRTYCQEIALRYSEDKHGSQKLATNIFETLLIAMNIIGIDGSRTYLEMSGELLLFFGELDLVNSSMMKSSLGLVEFLLINFKAFTLDLIQNNSEIFEKILLAKEEYELCTEIKRYLFDISYS